MNNYVDAVHGLMNYPDIIYKIIHTEEFQRLRNVKQLGVNSWIYPSGTHTRFEHCLGVCHLVDKLLSYLEINSKIVISTYHRNCVMIAGLLHDIGHGPFSHMWEGFVHLKKYNTWNHETTSCDITRSLFKNNNIKLSDNAKENIDAVELICALISGNTKVLEQYLNNDEMYLAEIVNNKFCFIDVDKWDYIMRDAYYLNNAICISKGFEQAFKATRVIKGTDNVTHIGYYYRHYPFVYELFQNRTNLHRHCYQNSVVLGIEELVINALVAAEDAGYRIKNVKMSEAHLHPNVYKYLDDTIIDAINISDDPRLECAQYFIKRLKQRLLYPIIKMTNNENSVNIAEQNLGNRIFRKTRKIASATEAMPKNIIWYDDKGEIVKFDVPSNWFEKHILYARDTLSTEEIQEIQQQCSPPYTNGI